MNKIIKNLAKQKITVNSNKHIEYCIYCEEEVKINSNFRIQRCPNCANYILPCSLCNDIASDCITCQKVHKDKINKRNEVLLYTYDKALIIKMDKLKNIIKDIFDIDDIDEFLSEYTYDDVDEIKKYI